MIFPADEWRSWNVEHFRSDSPLFRVIVAAWIEEVS